MIPTVDNAYQAFERTSDHARGKLTGIFPERVLVTLDGESEPTPIDLAVFDTDWQLVVE